MWTVNSLMFKLVLEKAEEPEVKFPTSAGSWKEFQKNIYFCFIDYAKAFDCVDHNKLWKILKEMGIPDLMTCLLRNLYGGQKASVKTRHGTIVQFSRSVVSDSLRPHEPQHARPPCLSPTPGVHPNSCPSSWWCHPTISPSVVPFYSCPQSIPASAFFQMSQFFASGDQSIGVSASASVLSMNTEDWSPLGYTGLISLQSKDNRLVPNWERSESRLYIVTLLI